MKRTVMSLVSLLIAGNAGAQTPVARLEASRTVQLRREARLRRADGADARAALEAQEAYRERLALHRAAAAQEGARRQAVQDATELQQLRNMQLLERSLLIQEDAYRHRHLRIRPPGYNLPYNVVPPGYYPY